MGCSKSSSEREAEAIQSYLRTQEKISNKQPNCGTSLVVQWLRIHLPNAGDTGSIPGLGRSHMPQSY